jgi:mono/diheme cytochrome c family protein
MKHGETTAATIVICVCSIIMFGCAMRRSEPLKGTFVPETAEVEHGQILYNEYCQKCHPEGEGGLGPDINWNPAPTFIKKFQVRHGLGVMPSFKSNEISKDDLKAIGKYMKAYKHQKRK